MTTPPPRAPLRPRAAEIVAAARAILETEGREALTMRRVADVVGIRAPSIYKHLPAKESLEAALIDDGLAEMGHALHAALDDALDQDPVLALMSVYRTVALANPNLYRLATSGPLARELLTPGLEDWAGEPWFLVCGDPNLAQAMWSFAHGMVILELDGRFAAGCDLGPTWQAGAAAFSSLTRVAP